jgi:hypothetical protein
MAPDDIPLPDDDAPDAEVGEVLKALQDLAARVSNPFVQASLAEAHHDIAHLVGGDASPDSHDMAA